MATPMPMPALAPVLRAGGFGVVGVREVPEEVLAVTVTVTDLVVRFALLAEVAGLLVAVGVRIALADGLLVDLVGKARIILELVAGLLEDVLVAATVKTLT